jgi:thioredoxin reductase (NADPH)
VSKHTQTQITALNGTDRLQSITWLHAGSGKSSTHGIASVFLMTGASPNTAWLEGCVALDDKGFVRTGADLRAEDLAKAAWLLPRPPHLLETSLPGVFAVGDVRAGSVKRVAAAVGEGSICVQFVHQALRELALPSGQRAAA